MSSDSTPRPRDSRATYLTERLFSLDAYRGLIMITLAFNGFGLDATATKHLAQEAHADSSFWKAVKFHFSHAEWVGGGYWDMIQPSFMFMVGVSMAYSYAKRMDRNHSYAGMLAHAMIRSLVLIFLGIFLISNWSKATDWSLMNVLTQIGLGYTFLFLLWDRPLVVQGAAAVVLLVGTWLAYVACPGTGLDPEQGSPDVGVKQEWAAEHLKGVPAAWHKNANLGHAIDTQLLNWLPRLSEFRFNGGGYQTINFIPSLATMLFGLMCGELLRSPRRKVTKFLVLLVAGIAAVAIGLAIDATGYCPLVKRIWTPSWAIYSTGWCCLMLAGLYGVIDGIGWRGWAFPLVVVGTNSIAIYCMGQLLRPWTAKALQTHLGPDIFKFKFGWEQARQQLDNGLQLERHAWSLAPSSWADSLELFEPMVQSIAVGMMFWLVCLWMYRQRVFVRI